MGAFIVLEGIDGTGKSTVCRRVAEALAEEGYDVELTAEPTHEGIGAVIRSGAAGNISQRAESLLFIADRFEHTVRIKDMVSEDRIVICDRYYASTLAYQSSSLEGDFADEDWLKNISEPFFWIPDTVILLDMDPEESIRRVGSRGEEESKFERIDFLNEVREAYLSLAEEFGYDIVDASASADEVFEQVMAIVRGHI